MSTQWYMQKALDVEDPYNKDPYLRPYLKTKLSNERFEQFDKELSKWSQRVATEVEALGRAVESNEPVFDQKNNSIDAHESWYELDRIAAEEKLIRHGYNRSYGVDSRLLQFAKLFLFHPSSGYFGCPLAMTDGAAKLIEIHGDETLKGGPFKHLISDKPNEFWTSGQWMTERSGGSDLRGTETLAHFKNNQWRASGPKHFTSAITAPMAILLAQTEKGLTSFYCQCRKDKQGPWQYLEIKKLKEKLGTRALPTAEIELKDMPVHMVGEEGQGVKVISSLFNVSRIHNAFAATSTSSRVLQLWDQFSRKRHSFGKPVAEHPLHIQTYNRMQELYKEQFYLSFFVAELLGKTEESSNPSDEKLLRLLTPLAKLYTAKLNIKVVSEALEGFGGAGYMEDMGIAKYYRDSQTLSIWEGTTNVLSLDVLRAIHKEEVLPPFINWVEESFGKFNPSEEALKMFANLKHYKLTEETARDFAFLMARLTTLCLKGMTPLEND